MEMSFGKKERDLLIGLAGILVAVAVWFLYTSPTMDKTDAIKAENETLRPKAEEYQAVYANLQTYQDGIVTLTAEKEDILAHFPSKIEREDELMFWSNFDKRQPEALGLGAIEMSETEAYPLAEATEVQYDADGNVIESESGNSYMLYGMPIAIQFASTYDGLKELANYVYSLNDKTTIDLLDVNFDSSTGFLTGSVGIVKYYITGTDKEYVPERVPSVMTGVDDLFHTTGVDLTVKDEQKADGEDAEGEDAEAAED